jgi:hypothetical protein
MVVYLIQVSAMFVTCELKGSVVHCLHKVSLVFQVSVVLKQIPLHIMPLDFFAWGYVKSIVYE